MKQVTKGDIDGMSRPLNYREEVMGLYAVARWCRRISLVRQCRGSAFNQTEAAECSQSVWQISSYCAPYHWGGKRRIISVATCYRLHST